MSPATPTEKSPPISVRRLAALLGTSRSTISRAFRNEASVRPELRARILAEAGRRSYRPDPLVSELMTNFARRKPIDYRETLGVLWWSERWRNSRLAATNFETRLKAGVERATEKHGCRATHFLLQPGGDAALKRILRARRIQGVIIAPPSVPGIEAPGIDWSSLSTVAIGRSLSAPSFNCVHHNHYAAMVRTLRLLKERGYRRPVLLVQVSLEERMQRAYTAAFLAHEAGPPERVLHLEAHDAARLERRLKALAPDVVIADAEPWIEALRTMKASSRRFGLVVLDVLRPDGRIAGMHQNVERMAGCAVDLLMQERFHNETGVPAEPISMLTPGVWVDGESLPAGPARAGGRF